MMRTHLWILASLLLVQVLHGFQDGSLTPEAVSLLGKPLFPYALTVETRAKLESEYATALANYTADSNNAENSIWLGRRTAYLWHYRKAVEIFTEGIRKHPSDARMYRHRGHRYITLREFDKAIADLKKAAVLIEGREDEIEPDGQPNRLNIPTSTLNFNIWYHLGLAHYLKGEFDQALQAYLSCLEFSWINDDRLVATTDWLSITLRRLGREDEAYKLLSPITSKLNIIENVAYHRRLLMYKGELSPDSLLNTNDASDLDLATQGYGVGIWHWVNGRTEAATKLFEQVVQGPYWAAFGYIAAEVELARLDRRR